MLEFYENGKKISDIDFGIVDAGETVKVELVIKNTYDDVIHIVATSKNDEDIKIEKFPYELSKGESGKAVISFTPKETRKTSLKSSDIGFRAVVG